MNTDFLTGTELLLAYEDIRIVKSRYCRYIDTKDWEALKNVFTPDAVADFSTEGNPIPVLEGRDTIVNVFQELVDPAITVHQVHSADIEFISATEARVISPMEDLVTFPEGNPNKSFHGYGYYHETFINQNGNWQISHTSLKRLRLDIL